MRVFVAGTSGAIGTRLVPQLIDAGHEVIGTARSAGSAERVRALGAKPVALDLLDARAVRQAVLASEPEAIVHEATALADLRDLKHFDRSFAQTNRLRTEGTDALLAAAREAGVRRFVAQSFATYGRYAREGGPVKTEDDLSDPTPVPAMRETFAAIRHLDQAVTEAGGIALRYGAFYGASNDGWSSRCAGGSFRSSATAAGSGHSSTSTTPPRRQCSRSNTTVPASTTSSTTSPPRCASGSRCSRRCSAPSRHAAFPAGSRGCSRARRW
jgi:nucleoside-diphosphate-sugar epimerase